MEAHTPTSSLLSEAPVAVYEVAFSRIRIAAAPGPGKAGFRGVPASWSRQARPLHKTAGKRTKKTGSFQN